MRRALKNVSWLLVAQFFGLLIPIIEIPILARALGAAAYGQFVMVQSFALLASLLIEYGFGISGARDISLVKGQQLLIAKVYNDVLSAKFLLTIFIIAPVILLLYFAGSNLDGGTFVFGFLYFIAFGFSPVWFFQGLERLKCVILVELLMRLAGLIVLALMVRDSNDYTLALTVAALFAFANTLFGNVLAVTIIGQVRLSFFSGINTIQEGFHLFVYKSSSNILTASGPALVSINSGAQALASYVPAEKVVKGLTGIASPILFGLFPLITQRFASRKQSSLLMPAMISAGFLSVGIVVSSVFTLIADWLVRVALGEGYEAAVELLRVFIWIVPLRMANQAMGLTILIPLHKDELVGVVGLISSVLAVLLAILLSSTFGASGAIAGFVLGELMVFIAFVHFICKIWIDRSLVCELSESKDC